MNERNGKEKVLRQNRVPERGGPRVDVVRLKGGECLTFCILSPSFWGFVIHWDERKRRSAACCEKRENCEGCRNELPQKWRGYLCVISQNKGKVFLEFTKEAANRLLDLVGDGESLRGLHFFLERTRSDNGRLRPRLLSTREDPDKLPADEDPEPILRFLWDWRRQ